ALLHAVEPRDAGELRDGHHRAARVTAATTAAVDGRGRVGPFLGRAAGGQGGGEGEDAEPGVEHRAAAGQRSCGAGHGGLLCGDGVRWWGQAERERRWWTRSSRKRSAATWPGSLRPTERSPTQAARPRIDCLSAYSVTAVSTASRAAAARSAGLDDALSVRDTRIASIASSTVLSPTSAPPRCATRPWIAVTSESGSPCSLSATEAAASVAPPSSAAKVDGFAEANAVPAARRTSREDASSGRDRSAS